MKTPNFSRRSGGFTLIELMVAMAITTIYKVQGMTCEHCVRAVTQELGAVEGVTAVDVDLPTGAVTVTSDRALEEATVRAAVDEAGYEVVP